MSEMVERVAAIIERLRPTSGNGITSLNIAHTVIAAMRDATDGMYAAAFKIEEERYAAHHPQEDMCAGDCWKAMIDEGLK